MQSNAIHSPSFSSEICRVQQLAETLAKTSYCDKSFIVNGSGTAFNWYVDECLTQWWSHSYLTDSGLSVLHYHPRSGVVIVLKCMCVCTPYVRRMYVRLYVCNMIMFKSLDADSSFLVIQEWGNTRQVHLRRSSDQGQGLRGKKVQKFLFLQCKTAIGNNTGSIEDKACVQHGVFGYGRSNGVTVIFVMWPEVA